MTDHPILFSAPMVRAILDGRKTMTRRVLKPQPAVNYVAGWGICRDGKPNEWTGLPSGRREPTAEDWQRWQARCVPCAWAPGDRLWVRETWRASSAHDDLVPAAIPQGDSIEYAADPERILTGRNRPSIHMPRWASRITLAVEAVRVERLQDISEGDAEKEGVYKIQDGWWSVCDDTPNLRAKLAGDSARNAFYFFWNTIHGPDAWDANPWVSVTTFRRVEA